MTGMKCFGYYLVKPMPTPNWCTIKSKNILSISESDLSYKFPDLTKCFWANYPQSDRDEYAKYLGLSSLEFSDFCKNVSNLFNENRLAVDASFSSLADALMLSTYIRKAHGYRLVGLYTDNRLFSKYEDEGYFKFNKAGDNINGGKRIGCEILGSNGDGFDSYIINSLNEILDKSVDLIIDNQTGLILNTYEEARHFSDMIQGMGEPVIWRPFELYEYEFHDSKFNLSGR